MSGHPSEPIGYVEQFKTDLWCSRAQRQSPDLASLLTVVLGCPLLGVRHASDGPPVDLSRYPRRSRNATESIRVPTLCVPDLIANVLAATFERGFPGAKPHRDRVRFRLICR